jgi:hypothetical protein
MLALTPVFIHKGIRWRDFGREKNQCKRMAFGLCVAGCYESVPTEGELGNCRRTRRGLTSADRELLRQLGIKG